MGASCHLVGWQRRHPGPIRATRPVGRLDAGRVAVKRGCRRVEGIIGGDEGASAAYNGFGGMYRATAGSASSGPPRHMRRNFVRPKRTRVEGRTDVSLLVAGHIDTASRAFRLLLCPSYQRASHDSCSCQSRPSSAPPCLPLPCLACRCPSCPPPRRSPYCRVWLQEEQFKRAATSSYHKTFTRTT
jgi:hypothetical protein